MIYDGQSLPFQDQVFDGVVLYGVLEHVGSSVKDTSWSVYT